MAEVKVLEGLKRMIDRQLEHGKKEESQQKKELVDLFESRARAHIMIIGKVQGVFFRSFVEKTANDLRLLGIVRNTEDGSVEVVAEGEKSALDKLIDQCKHGPTWSAVTDVQVKWEKFKGEFSEFLVR